jgi:hypothetical protein
MVGAMRFIRHGLVISALGHVGMLAVGLLFVRASSQQAVPPDATLVEIVTPNEMPRLSGTPSALPTSGSEAAATSQPATAVSEPSVPPRPEKKEQKAQKDQRKSQRNAAQKPQAQQTAPPQPQAPPMTQTETADVAVAPPPPPAPPDPPAPSAAETPDAPETAATAAQLAQLALLGGWLGGGFDAAPIDSPFVDYDFTLPFREVVSACAPPVPGVGPREKISVRMRIFLNRDGTLAKAPLLREQNPSAKQQAMMESFLAGLKKCQPYTMLPPDRYDRWKIIDLLVFPMNSFGG